VLTIYPPQANETICQRRKENKKEGSHLSIELSAWVHSLVGSLWSYEMEIQSSCLKIIICQNHGARTVLSTNGVEEIVCPLAKG
jgi:hypothetical protein